MSKSISGGLGAVNLTIQELRLIDGKFTDLTASNGTISNQLNGNDATFTGTISTNHFSVTGTFSISNLAVSGLIDAYKLDVENELKYKTEDTDDRYIRKSGSVNETITGTKTFSSIVCNTSVATNELKGLNDVSIYARSGSDLAYVLGLKINVTNSTFYNSVIVGTASNNKNLTVYGSGLYSGGLLSASLGTTGAITSASLATTGAITKNGVNVLNQTESDARYFQLTTSDFSITNLTASGFIKLSNVINEATINTDQKILFLNADSKISGNADFTFKPDTKTLKCDNIEATSLLKSYDLELTNDLTVTGKTNLGAIVSISTLNSVISNTTYPLLVWDNTNTTSRTIRTDTSKLYYDTTNDTLYSPNLSVSGNITGDIEGNDITGDNFTLTGTNNATFNVSNNYGVYYNHVDGHIFRMDWVWKLRIDTNSTTLYNDFITTTGIINTSLSTVPIKLQVNSTDKIVIEDTKTCIKNTVCLETVGVPSASANFVFLLLNEGTNEIKKTNYGLQYNPSSETLTVENITAEEITYKNQTLDERFGNGSTTLPINYTQIFSDNKWKTDYNIGNTSPTRYFFGDDGSVLVTRPRLVWYNDTSVSSPRYYQKGKNITGGAWEFDVTDGKLSIRSNDYSGNWRVYVSAVFENETNGNGGYRVAPEFRVFKGSSQVLSTSQEPQYSRYWGPRYCTIVVSGVITVDSTSDEFEFRTYLTTGSSSRGSSQLPTNSKPNAFWSGHDLNIELQYLNDGTNNSETVMT
jgi:hypothetical protein